MRIMLDEAANEILVKASGGIRTREVAEKYLDMGAARLGASNPASMLIGK